MKPAELHDLDELALDRRLGELREEMFNLRFQQATRQLTNTDRLRLVKKDIARVLTRMSELSRAESAD